MCCRSRHRDVRCRALPLPLAQYQHGLLPRLTVTRHALEGLLEDRHVDAVRLRLATFLVNERVVDVDIALVEAGDDDPVGEFLLIDPIRADQNDGDAALLDLLLQVRHAEAAIGETDGQLLDFFQHVVLHQADDLLLSWLRTESRNSAPSSLT